MASHEPVRRAAEAVAERIDEPWGSLTWLAGASCGNATGLTLGRVVIRAGQANPRHCHPNCEEALYLLRGRLVHSLGAQRLALEPGDTLMVPAGVFHHAEVAGSDDAEMIVAYSSAERGFVLEN